MCSSTVRPQQTAVPSVHKAQARSRPVLTVLNLPPGGVYSIALPPQHRIEPSGRMPHRLLAAHAHFR